MPPKFDGPKPLSANRSRTLSADDRIEIEELFARFCHHSDYQEWDALKDLYTADVITEMEGVSVRYVGPDAQVEHARLSAEQTDGKNRHIYFNFVIEERDDAIIAHYFNANINAGAKPMEPKLVVTGRHADTVVKTASGWRISHRMGQFDQQFELDW